MIATFTLLILSKVVKEDSLGNLEMLLMCFYLPSEYQPNHSHPHKVQRNLKSVLDTYKHNVAQTKFFLRKETKPAPVARHASHSAPTPMEDSRVEILTRCVNYPLTFSPPPPITGLRLTSTCAPLIVLP